MTVEPTRLGGVSWVRHACSRPLVAHCAAFNLAWRDPTDARRTRFGPDSLLSSRWAFGDPMNTHSIMGIEAKRIVSTRTCRFALALGGGAARGLAHIGVLEVLERQGIRPAFIAGTSIGGLVAALSGAGLGAREMRDLAREFRFPRWFIPGGTLAWKTIFPSAAHVLAARTFEDLSTPIVLGAVDLEQGVQVILNSGSVLSAVEATCAVPGVLSPVRRDGRWLVDGGLVNILPVDLASMAEPDAIVAVKIGAHRAHPMPQLAWPVTSIASRLGRALPNFVTAKVSFEILVRGAEIALEQATRLATAMAEPEVFIEVDIGDIGLRDFKRLDEAVEAGRRAAERALPLLEAIAAHGPARASRQHGHAAHVDPVCKMVVSAGRARALIERNGVRYYFCSPNCRDSFEREPSRFLPKRSAD